MSVFVQRYGFLGWPQRGGGGFLCGFRRGAAGYVGMFFHINGRCIDVLLCGAVWVFGYGV